MQVFIIGTPLETAKALDRRRLNKQIIECQQILDALNGAKAWSNHPCVLQYIGCEAWLSNYKLVLDYYRQESITIGEAAKGLCREFADFYNDYCQSIKPPFHTQEYFSQMKRRLYTKNPEHYKQWAYLGKSDVNWYWSQKENKFIRYRNGKRIE